MAFHHMFKVGLVINCVFKKLYFKSRHLILNYSNLPKKVKKIIVSKFHATEIRMMGQKNTLSPFRQITVNHPMKHKINKKN
jgi:hypothetical protein